MRIITNIVIHCTAGHTSAERVQDFFTRPVSKGGRGWKIGGYHVIIEKDGTKKYMHPFSQVTNGVKGFNSNIINIAYVGGVDEKDYTKPKYTATHHQERAMGEVIEEALEWMKSNGQDITKNVGIVGHRDFSDDKNKNGAIEPWERIKACPSFDVIPFYGLLYSSKDRYLKLPTQK